jgi:hypothetical protein
MTGRTRLQTVRGAVWAGIIASGLMAGCSRTPLAIRDLPELPDEFSRDLALARTAPVLMAKPATAPTPPQPRDGGTIFAIARACKTYYDGYVLYPMTVCYPPSSLYETLVVGALERSAPDAGAKSQTPPARYFKLTSHPQAKLGGPWFCTVRSGPWYGHVEGAQLCSVDPNIRMFHADILGAPETVAVYWTGALTDVPPPLNLLGIQPTSESCVCCSGVTCPNGNCATDFQHCGVGPPALK